MMSYVIEDTKWLSDEISQDVKGLIAKYFGLADSKQSDAGHLMATEVFTADAVMMSSTGTHKGFEAISKSRDNAWSVVTSRRHIISKAFAGQGENLELILLGSAHMDFVNGKYVDIPLAAHLKIEHDNGRPHISYLNVYADGSIVSSMISK